MSGLLSAFAGAVLEAWAELRIHRTRVLLSLIGVAVAVAALTSVLGISAIAQQAMVESFERQSGRPASVTVQVSSADGASIDGAAVDAAIERTLERYDIRYATRQSWSQIEVQFADGAVVTQARGIDPAYGAMFRQQLALGEWFTERDAGRLAPALVVNGIFHERLGSPSLAEHPTVTLRGEPDRTAVVIGVVESQPWEYEPQAFMLVDQLSEFGADDPAMAELGMQRPSEWTLWLPPDRAEELRTAVRASVAAILGDEVTVETWRQDYLAWDGGDPMAPFTLTVGGIALLVLALGVLGLLNIALVTVKYRVREIGIRRSFGATASRVFFTVMSESVVATAVAGVVGVMIAVAVVSNPWLQSLVLGGSGIDDLPPFPMSAALAGIAVAVGAGALAGLLPALVAVRVRVIDAIRY